MGARAFAFLLCACLPAVMRSVAWGQTQPAVLPADAPIEIAPQAPEPKLQESQRKEDAEDDAANAEKSGPQPASLGEAPPPPPRPHHKGVVLESTAGVLGFAGQFRHVAPPAYFTHILLGYEPFSWFMLFGEAELAFTDTSESQDPSHSRAFPMWGMGGGARATLHEAMFAFFFQADIGALTAYVPHDALAYMGFRGAESLGPFFGTKVGVEWYQRDRHFAVTIQGGPRIAQGFSKFASSDLPLMWDVAVGLRYTF